MEFGPFRLFPAERRLLQGETPIPIGSRELDILVALVERAGEVVTKRELFARVWPGMVVEESSLRVQIAGLRRVLADGQDGARYIVTVAGRGYTFTGSVPTVAAAPLARTTATLRRPDRVIGRELDIKAVKALLTEHQFVTIHGPGGIGKTTLGLTVASLKGSELADGVCFVDLSLNAGLHTVANAVASALGLIMRAGEPTAHVLNFIRNRNMLLVLDSCETTIDAAAALAESIINEAAGVLILATSREPLRSRGEHVYPLAPLIAPPEGATPKASELLAFPAAQLFCERAADSGYRAELGDADAIIVGDICRRLDGNALAIELAASRVSTYGLRQTAELLDSHMRLAWRGRRTAPPRHQTLKAMLDWSYALIGEPERALLRQLSVFVGGFGLDEARGVIDGGNDIVETLEQLVLKSLVAADTTMEPARYRLLDTTREYANARLVESGAARETSRRHALYYLDRLSRSTGATEFPPEWFSNIRTALDWAFSNAGDSEIGLQLATCACELFVRLGMLTESRHWSERALSALPPDQAGSHQDMVLRASLGYARIFAGGDMKAARQDLEHALDMAERLDDPAYQFQLLSGLHEYSRRIGAVDELLPIAQRAAALAPLLDAPAKIAVQAMLGFSHHIRGNLAEACTALAAVRDAPPDLSAMMNVYGFHRDAYLLIACTLWMRGYPDQAADAARSAASVDERKDPVTACVCLMWRAICFHLRGDWAVARDHIEQLLRLAGEHGLAPYAWFGAGLRGDVKVHCGEVDAGINELRESLRRLREGGYIAHMPWLTCCLAETLAARRDIDEAQSLLAVFDGNPSSRPNLAKPELLRVRGAILAQAGDATAAERAFQVSLDIADAQGSLSWRLRTVSSQARLHLAQGRFTEARDLLADTYARFTEGFETRDLRAARALIGEIEARARADVRN